MQADRDRITFLPRLVGIKEETIRKEDPVAIRFIDHLADRTLKASSVPHRDGAGKHMDLSARTVVVTALQHVAAVSGLDTVLS